MEPTAPPPTEQKNINSPSDKPLTKGTHFALSLLASAIGAPLGMTVVGIIMFGLIIFTLVVIGLSAGGTSAVGPRAYEYEYKYGRPGSYNRLVSIPVNGPIVSQSSANDPLSQIFGAQFADGEKIKEHLGALSRDPSVRGVILEIDSPGGLITASKAISDGVGYVRAANKPIIAHINGYGASGAYWAAAGTNKILAEQGSATGSIGVILGDIPYFADIVGLGDIQTESPIQIQSFSAGKGKDLGNPYRAMTNEEKQFLEQMLQREYDHFAAYVAQQRQIDLATLKNVIGALPYDNAEAARLKLIDATASKEEAYLDLARLANLDDDYVIEQELIYSGFFDGFFGALKRRVPKSAVETKKEARSRYCAKLVQTPLVLHGSLRNICD